MPLNSKWQKVIKFFAPKKFPTQTLKLVRALTAFTFGEVKIHILNFRIKLPKIRSETPCCTL